MDPYAACPCGSGKKFKWCCQPIYADITRAFQQDEVGQHDAALQKEELTAAHPQNPEAWGRKAELLDRNEKLEEAEAALQRPSISTRTMLTGCTCAGQFRLRARSRSPAAVPQGSRTVRPQRRRDPGAHLRDHLRLRDEAEPSRGRPGGRGDVATQGRPRDCQGGRRGLRRREPEPAPGRQAQVCLQVVARRVASERRAAWDKALSSAATGSCPTPPPASCN